MHKYIRVFYEKTNEANSRRAFVINLLNIISLLSLLIIIPQQSQAAAASSGITYTGRILDSSDQPVTASQVYFNITISDPDQKCWLYTEQRLVDMSSSAGNFSFEVGSNDPTTLYGTPSLNNPLGGGPATFADLFDNTKSFSNLAVGSYTSCTGTYDPSTATDKYSGRVMAIFFRIGAAGTDQALPALRITPVPMAMQAINSVKVNGYAASQLLKFGPTVNQTLGDLTQTNYDDLIDLITGASTKYLKSNTTFAGDVSGTASTMSVDKIKGKSVATPATSGDVLTYNGASLVWQAPVATGIANLNGITTASQSFASGTTPLTISSSSSTHTFNITNASSGSSGLVTQADWNTFNSKQSSSLANGSVWIGNASGGAQAQTLSGDATVSASGNVTVDKTQTAQASKILQLDSSGNAYVNGVDIKGSGAVAASIRYTGASNMVMNLPTTSGTANQFLQTDGAGNLSWASQSAMLPAITAGQVWVGNASGGAEAFSLSGDVSSVSNTGLVTLTSSATGSNKLPLAGGTMSGAINMGGQNISNAGDVSLAAGKFLGLGAGSTDGTVAGQIWYDAGVIKYFDGTTAKSLGVAGAGITNINGLTAGTQSFAIGTAGNAPAFTSATSTHTLDIPMASASGTVTAGLISNADYVSFSGKQSNSLAAGEVWVGNASGVSEARALSGDIFSVSNTGLVTVNKTTTGQSNYIMALDGSGVANAYGVGIKGATSGTVTLQAPTTVTNYSLTYPAAQGGANQVLSNDGSGVMSWMSVLTGITNSASLTNGKLWIGNASGVAAEVAMSGDATIDNAGLLTLKNTGTVGTYSKVVTDAQGRVVSGSALASGDVTTALGFTPVNVAGDSMSGDLITQNISMVPNKYLGLSANSTDGTVAGQMWYDTGVIKYFDGTTVKSLGVAGAGITTLNGLSSVTQTFAVGTAGTDFAITSSGSGHTFDLPSASATNRGALTSADWSTFNAKQSNSLSAASVWVGNASGGAEARALSGDVTIDNVGLVTLKNTGSVGSYYKVVTDAQGRVVSGSTTLGATDLPALNDGTIWIGNSGNTAVGYAMSGDATMSNVGLLTLKNTGSVGTYSKVVTDAQGRVVSGSALASGDVTTALGFTPVNVAGDTMAGALNFGANDISNTGNISMAANKYFGLSANGTDGTVAGQMWYDAGVIKYYDGTTVKSLGVAGAGITTLNGLSSVTQSFIVGSAGNAPAITSSGSGHTFDFPMASASGSVTAGLISNADYVSFSGKQSTSLAAGEMWVGNASGVAQAFSLSGDVASVSNTGLVTVNKSTTGQSNYIMALDGSGVANAYGVGIKGATSGTVTLQSAGTTANYSLTFPAAQGGANQVLSNDGSGVMSWATALTGITDSAALTNGKLWIGNASGIAAEVNVSGDATMDNAGVMTLKNTGTVGTYFKVVTDAQGRVTSGAALASGDVTTALGFTPVNVAGDSMSGDLITQNISMVPNKYFGLSANSTDGTVAGQMWYDAGTIKYFDGTTVKSLGVAGAGITSLNGLSTGTQSFAIGTSGNAPAFTSGGSTHTLDIPMASASGSVTAGLLSNAEYVALNAKQSSTLAAGEMWVGNASGGAQAFALSGDIASVSNTGAVVVNKTTTGQSNYIMALDGSGVANAYGVGIKGATSGTVTLQAPASPANYSLTFPAAQGGANQVLSNDGSGVMSWVTALTGITDSAALTNGKLWIGNASGIAAEVNVSGDATMDNAGVMTLKNTGTVGTYFKVVTDAQGRVTSGAALASGDVTGALGYTPVNRAGDTMVGALITTAGTAAAPSLGIGQTTSGLFSGGTDILAFSTAGTERMRILANGRFGIGTTTPNSIIEINSGAPEIRLKNTAATAPGFLMTSNTGSTYVTSNVNYNYNLADSSKPGWIAGFSQTLDQYTIRRSPSGSYSESTYFTVSSTGNVGIGLGDTNASTKLQVNGGSILAGPKGTAAGDGGEVRFGELAVNGSNYVGFKAPDTLAADKIWTLPATDGTANQVLATNGSGVLSWATGSADNLGNHTATQNIILNGKWLSNDGGNQGVRVTNSGRVGIGLSTPSVLLELAPNGTNAPQMRLTNATDNSQISEIESGNFAVSGTAYKIKASGATNAFQLQTGISNGTSINYSTPGMVMTSTGEVGIGTSSPLSPLHFSSTNTATSGTLASFRVTPTYNQASGTASNTDLLINRTQTAVGSGAQNLIDAQVDGVSKFKVDNNGNITASGVNVGNYTLEKTFFVSFGSVANQKVDLVLGDEFWGGLEVSLASSYGGANATGQIRKVFAFGGNPGGTIYRNDSFYSLVSGSTSSYFAISNVTWDATLSAFKIQIVSRSSSNNYVSVNLRAIASESSTMAKIRNASIGSIYTTDSTTFPAPAVTVYGGNSASLNLTLDSTLSGTKGNVIIAPSGGNVGIGTSSPASTVHIASTVPSGLSFSNVDGLVIDNSGSSDSFYALQIGTATGKIFSVTNSGKVGIGTTSPAAKLDVAGEVKFGNTSSTCNSTNEGQQRYNSTSKNMEFCNGTSWTPYGTGRTSCPAGFTLIGTSGSAEAFCISTNEEATATWLNAVTACYNKQSGQIPRARLCTSSEWTMACVSGLPTAMTGNWEWVADLYSSTASVAGNASCSSFNDDLVSASYKSRCCFH